MHDGSFRRRFFKRSIKNRRTLTKFAWSYRVDAVGGGRIGRLVIDGFCGGGFFVSELNLSLLLNDLSLWLPRLCLSPKVGSGILSMFCTGIRPAVPRECLTWEGRSTVPAGWNGEIGRRRNNNVRVDRFRRGRWLVAAALAVLRKRLAWKNDRFG
jgi:hypothetical protein